MRQRGELSDEEEAILGIERDTPEQEAAAEKERAEKLHVRQAYLLSLMENYLFREWLMEELVNLGTFQNSFGAGPTGFPDHMATQFQLGQKAAGWHLWCLFDDLAPDLASRMRRGA